MLFSQNDNNKDFPVRHILYSKPVYRAVGDRTYNL